MIENVIKKLNDKFAAEGIEAIIGTTKIPLDKNGKDAIFVGLAHNKDEKKVPSEFEGYKTVIRVVGKIKPA